MANPNGGNFRVVSNGSAGNGAKVDPKDPQVRKLVYNMYRGMLDQKHQKANVMVDSAPQENVIKDVGVGSRVESMMRQQSELKGGNMNAGGPPPPPPPPPIPGVLPTSRLPSEIPAGRTLAMNPPAALAGAMLKDKKPFTYTPGGLDLSEINSQGQAQNGGDPLAPVQSRSFRLLQNVLDTHDSTDGPNSGMPMKVEVPPSNVTSGPRGFTSVSNMGQGGNCVSQQRGSTGQQNGGYKVIPIQQDGDDAHFTAKQMGGYKANGSNPNQLSSIFKNQVRMSSDSDEARSRGGYFPAKTMVVSQRIEPQGPVHIPNLRQPQPSKPQPTPSHFQQPNTNYQQPGHFQHPSPYQPHPQHPGVSSSVGPSEQEVPEPKKYMGGSIPSRSFRILQAMTSPDDASDNGVPANASETTQPPDGDKQHAANQIPSPTWKSTNPSSPTSLSPPLSTLTTTNDISSDSGISSPSKVSPTYTTTKDSKVYRNVAPKISLNGPKQERVVNSALSHSHSKESSSLYSNSSSPTWKVNQATKFFPPVSVQKPQKDSQESDQNSPRLMKIIRQESSSPQENPEMTERRYEGAHIPSRVFRHLQSEYPGSPGDVQDSKPCINSKSPSPRHEGGPIPPRVIKSLQNENINNSFESDASSSYAELDEYYSNGAAKMAVHKDTVLKELTSQFDHMGTRKKPKAAPGKVFKYLQAQYDTPEEPDTHHEPQVDNTLRLEGEEVCEFGYRGSKLPSPSFRFLQNQYQEEQLSEVTQDKPLAPDAPNYEKEPVPYRGARIPGRTFRSLQENGGAHPSVLGRRK